MKNKWGGLTKVENKTIEVTIKVFEDANRNDVVTGAHRHLD